MTFRYILREWINCQFVYAFSYLHLPSLIIFNYNEWPAKIPLLLALSGLNFALRLMQMSDCVYDTSQVIKNV